MMQTEITREFRWAMGHALMHHKGQCYTPHGHNYRMMVTVSGEVDPVTEMVVDFSELDDLGNTVVRGLDHKFLANENDTRFFPDETDTWEACPGDPTAEHLARMCYMALALLMKDEPYTLKEVKLYETDKAYATVRG
jgi:6-pyruvoyltetrahydropterin/6-carboxytetrahydropterin synthase